MDNEFCLSIYKQAKKILSQNPHIPLQPFMSQMLRFFSIDIRVKNQCDQAEQLRKKHLLISEQYEKNTSEYSNKDITVHIIGAGPAGLLLARSLLNESVNIHIYEKRPENQSTARLHSIGIRYASYLLKILDKNESKELMSYGGQYDSQEDILRIPIAGLQLFLKKTIQNKVTFHYGKEICPFTLGKSLDSQSNIIIISGGKSMATDMSTLFEQKTFPNFQGICRYTWLLDSIQEAPLGNKLVNFTHGPDWVRTFRTIAKKDRLLQYYQYYRQYSKLDKTSELVMDTLKTIHSDHIALTVIVSTDKTNFNAHRPIMSYDIKVTPSISTKQIIRHPDSEDLPYILFGDVTGQAHPISLSGMTKVIRVIPKLKSLILNYKTYWILKEKALKSDINAYCNLIEEEFEITTLAMQEYVCFRTMVCTLYEKAAS